MLMGIVVPVIVPRGAASQAGEGPVLTETLPLVGAVNPAGTEIVACEPETKSLLLVFSKVKVKVVPVLPAPTATGTTVIAPSPLLASPESVNVVCAVKFDDIPVAVNVNETPRSCGWMTNFELEIFPESSATADESHGTSPSLSSM